MPFRNAIFLSAAVAYAVSVGADKIFYGAQGSDEPCYPIVEKNSIKHSKKPQDLEQCQEISIQAPFSNMRKSDVIKKAAELGVPLESTWSCYLDLIKHCGRCESCVNRKKAFLEAGVKDPTTYEA